jgi:uncharacterized membrane protein
MYWNRCYAAGSYLRSAVWTVPLIALLLEQVAIRAVSAIDSLLDWVPRLATTATGTSAVMDTVVNLAIAFIVFTFGSMLVAIQVAGGQMTPRIIATALLRDNIIRSTAGLFIFTLLFAAGAKARIDQTVPHVTVTIAIVSGMASVTAFLFLIDYTARLLRPISIVWRIGEQGIKVIESVYPDRLESSRVSTRSRQPLGSPGRSVERRGISAVVLAVNLKALVTFARTAGGVIEFIPRVGDFVAIGEPLFHLYDGATTIGDRLLRGQVAFGPERTIEQDSTFAFRVIVDVAIKALSKAINDPTTAVLAIDQLHRLLRSVGRRHLHDDALYDEDGQFRLLFPTPNWTDFVELSFREIRLYGAKNFQIARRLHAMGENLTQSLPVNRQPALRRELDLLDRTLEGFTSFRKTWH